MKTMFLWNMSKSQRLPSTFFPTMGTWEVTHQLLTRPDTRQSSRGLWAGAVMQKSLGIQKCDGPTDRRTDRPTWQGVESCVRNEKIVRLVKTMSSL